MVNLNDEQRHCFPNIRYCQFSISVSTICTLEIESEIWGAKEVTVHEGIDSEVDSARRRYPRQLKFQYLWTAEADSWATSDENS